MTKIVKNRVYIALIAISFIAGFYLDSPLKFLTYMAFLTIVVSLVVNSPDKRQHTGRTFGYAEKRADSMSEQTPIQVITPLKPLPRRKVTTHYEKP